MEKRLAAQAGGTVLRAEFGATVGSEKHRDIASVDFYCYYTMCSSDVTVYVRILNRFGELESTLQLINSLFVV